MTKGEWRILFVPPGWILAGLVEEQGARTVIHEGIYLETVAEGHSCWDIGETIAGAKVVWPIPAGTWISSEAILISAPATPELAKLCRSRDRATRRGAP